MHRPVVRRRLFRTLLVLLLLLLLVVARAAWDYVEARRFQQIITEIQAKAEPVTTYETRPPVVRRGDPNNAARHYAAAADLLVSPVSTVLRALREAQRASPIATPPADVRVQTSELLDQNSLVFELIRQAGTLEFLGRPPSIPTWDSQMHQVSMLLSVRTADLAFQGDGDAAAASLLDALRMLRIFRGAQSYSFTKDFMLFRAAADLALVIEQTEPSDAALHQLQTALGASESPEVFADSVLGGRASFIERWRRVSNGRRPISGNRWSPEDILALIIRPWTRRAANTYLGTWAELIDAARQPWPQKLDAINAVHLPEFRWGFSLPSDWHQRQSVWIAHALAIHRCAVVVAMIERYRRAHAVLPTTLDELVPAYADSLPVDPLSGEDFRYTRDEGGYIVYSVGSNRTDDEGDLGKPNPYTFVSDPFPSEAPDWGMRIRLAPR